MKNRRRQFGIRRLMVLTAAVAVVITISLRIDAPRLAQGVLAVYFISLVGWAVMRGPTVCANLAEVLEQRRQLKQRRIELESKAQELKRTRAITKSTDDYTFRRYVEP
jgi:hypothetical protein